MIYAIHAAFLDTAVLVLLTAVGAYALTSIFFDLRVMLAVRAWVDYNAFLRLLRYRFFYCPRLVTACPDTRILLDEPLCRAGKDYCLDCIVF